MRTARWLLLLTALFASLPTAWAGETDQAEGTVVILRDTRRAFSRVADALAVAEDGDVLRLAAGTFEGPVEIAGIAVRLEGAGAAATTLTAPGTVLSVTAGARITLSGVAVVSTGGSAFEPAVLLHGPGSALEECAVRGAAGFGIEVRGAGSAFDVYGCTVRGNAGGGIRLTDSAGRVTSTLIADNGGPGLLLEGTPPPDTTVDAQHDTIVRNVVQGVPVCAAVPGALDAPVPAVLANRLSFSYNVASGRIPEGLLTPAARGSLQRTNVFVWPAQVADAFEDVEAGDYRPTRALPTDAQGLEVGAVLSESGSERLAEAIEDALVSGQLGDALRLARRAAPERRSAEEARVRAALYQRFVEFGQSGQLGLAVRDFVLVRRHAPAGWGVEERLEQTLGRLAAVQGISVDWSGAFASDKELAPLVTEALAGDVPLPARAAAAPNGAPARWVVGATSPKALLLDRQVEPFERRLEARDPEYQKRVDALAMETERRKRADTERRAAGDEVAGLRAKHGAESAFVRAKQRELDRLSDRVAEIDGRLRALAESVEHMKPAYEAIVTGSTDHLTARAEAHVELLDPAGQRRAVTETLAEEERYLVVAPAPALGFAGLAPRTGNDTTDRLRFSRALVVRTLFAAVAEIERTDLDRLTMLLGIGRAGALSPAHANELYTLLALYAPRIVSAREALVERDELRALAATLPTPTEPTFALTVDPATKPPLRLTVTSGAERARVEGRLEDLERRLGGYGTVLDALRVFLTERVGISLDELLSALRPGAASPP